MAIKNKPVRRRAAKKGTTLAELRRRLERDNAYVSPEDGQELLEAINEGRRRERELVRGKAARKKTGS